MNALDVRQESSPCRVLSRAPALDSHFDQQEIAMTVMTDSVFCFNAEAMIG